MAQVTKNQRAQMISDLVREANKQPPTEKHPVEQIQGVKGATVNCDVITIAADQLLLNPNSHRIKAQLSDDPQWVGSDGSPGLNVDPHSDNAQMLIADYIRKSEYYTALKQSLIVDEQRQNALVTHEGILINGNTRAVALRELANPSKRYIRVAVLPQHMDPLELKMIELRFQMQRELKSKYSLTNELLFVEELHNSGVSYEQINAELRYDLDSPKKGVAEVKTRLEGLDFVRLLQKRVSNGLRLTRFDCLGYEQLRETQSRYRDLQASGNLAEADQYLDNFMLSMLLGVTAVHKLRKIDSSFMSSYMFPQLEEDDEIGLFAAELATATKDARPKGSRELDKLAPRRNAQSDGTEIDTKKLIAIACEPGKSSTFHQGDVRVNLENGKIVRALVDAVESGIREKRRQVRTEDKLAAPLESIRDATKRLQQFLEVYTEVAKNPDFNKARRQRVTHAFRSLRKRYRDVELLVAKLDS